MQLKRLARMQNDGEVLRRSVGRHPENLGQECNLGQHIAHQKVDGNGAQGVAELGCRNGFVIHRAPPFLTMPEGAVQVKCAGLNFRIRAGMVRERRMTWPK